MLEDLAFAHLGGRFGYEQREFGVVDLREEPEYPRKHVITGHHANDAAVAAYGGFLAATGFRIVDDVVVQQGGRVEQLDRECDLLPDLGPGIQHLCGQEGERGPQPFPACADKVVDDRLKDRKSTRLNSSHVAIS